MLTNHKTIHLMKKVVLALVFLTLSCDTQKTKQDNSAFDEVLEAYYQENLSLYRINATFQWGYPIQ